MRIASRVLLLGLVALVFCAPLFRGLQSVDQENDEAIYSYAVESILETGDWLNPWSSPTPGVVFLEKPPLKFWIVALPIRLGLLPNNDFGLRFWDAAFGSLAFLYVFSFGRRLAGWSSGVVAVLALYTFDELIFNHGLRGNNMEAALVLAYAGGVYHYLRWAETETPGEARAHAAAVGFYFFLGFMTKFVAALFLPAVLGAASLELPAVRSRVLKEWQTWVAVCAGIVLLVAPWFVYQTVRTDSEIWSVMFGEHVVTRFRASLDPAHVKPWYFYFAYFFGKMVNQGIVWAVLAGALLIHLRVMRERWLAGTLVLYWFWLPFAAISFGSSKLWHYAYPFLAPAGLAAGYLVGSMTIAVARSIGVLTDPVRSRTVALPASVAALIERLRPAWPWFQRLLLTAAIGSVILGGIGLVYPGRMHILDLTVRMPQALRSGLTALLLGLLAGRGAWTARLAVPLILLTFMPFSDYRWAGHRTTVEAHPMRSTSECIARVRDQERSAGRPVRDMLVYLPGHTFMHPYFFYYRTFGWERQDELPDATLLGILDNPTEQRPVLLPDDRLSRILQTYDPPGKVRPSVLVADGVKVLLPGPYSGCASR
jgi:4-amino-4-deoxy-L-arabinose transferase-like glycosyltransferase